MHASKECCSREDVPTEQRVEAVFLHHLGLSYRQVGKRLAHSHQPVYEWYTALSDLFEPEPAEHGTVIVDGDKVSVWASIDRHTDDVPHVEASSGRFQLDALRFLRTVLERCRERTVNVVDCGPWYNWGLNELELACESYQETWGDRSIVKSWFSPFTQRIKRLFDRFLYRSSWDSVDRWTNAFALIYNGGAKR